MHALRAVFSEIAQGQLCFATACARHDLALAVPAGTPPVSLASEAV
jgi:hypothetical protein